MKKGGNFYGSQCIKQASHWHDKGFTPWHAILRASEGRIRASVRGDAWRCGSGEVVKCSKIIIYFQSVSTRHDEFVSSAHA